MNSGGFTEKFGKVFAKKQPAKNITEDVDEQPSEEGGSKVGEVFSVLVGVVYRLRKVFMAIPVVYYALKLAAYNTENLPEMVGINLQSTGEYAEMISRQSAVFGPLVVTAACLVMMFFSRKSVYPWLISIFTLVLPILILVTNIYPA